MLKFVYDISSQHQLGLIKKVSWTRPKFNETNKEKKAKEKSIKDQINGSLWCAANHYLWQTGSVRLGYNF